MRYRLITSSRIFMFLFMVFSVIVVFHAKVADAAMMIPTTTSTGGINGAIQWVGGKIGEYGSSAMWVLYSAAGISAVLGFLEYMFMREHKKVIHTTLGVAVVSAVGGVIAQAVSHGQTSSSANGALITLSETARHMVIYASAHLNNAVIKK